MQRDKIITSLLFGKILEIIILYIRNINVSLTSTN